MSKKNGSDNEKGSRYISGSTELCECPQCGNTKPREEGIPCTEETCPNCGNKMIRSM